MSLSRSPEARPSIEVPLRTTTTLSGRAAAARSPAPASEVGVPPGSAIEFGGGSVSSPERTMK